MRCVSPLHLTNLCILRCEETGTVALVNRCDIQPIECGGALPSGTFESSTHCTLAVRPLQGGAAARPAGDSRQLMGPGDVTRKLILTFFMTFVAALYGLQGGAAARPDGGSGQLLGRGELKNSLCSLQGGAAARPDGGSRKLLGPGDVHEARPGAAAAPQRGAAARVAPRLWRPAGNRAGASFPMSCMVALCCCSAIVPRRRLKGLNSNSEAPLIAVKRRRWLGTLQNYCTTLLLCLRQGRPCGKRCVAVPQSC